jgi:hypothetical protein
MLFRASWSSIPRCMGSSACSFVGSTSMPAHSRSTARAAGTLRAANRPVLKARPLQGGERGQQGEQAGAGCKAPRRIEHIKTVDIHRGLLIAGSADAGNWAEGVTANSLSVAGDVATSGFAVPRLPLLLQLQGRQARK